MILAFIKSLRPKQWTKNLLVFAGILFASRFYELDLWINVIAGFFIFCALSGVVYITNDIVDMEKDREHPKKRNRPIASGAISPTAAGIGAVIVLIASLVGAWYITFTFFICAVIYVVLVTAYSFKLKHVVVMDIMVLAMGFVVRAMAGIEAMHVERLRGDPIEITPYFILTTLFLALFLAITKRRSEMNLLQENAAGHRKVLEEYSMEFLDVLLTVATTGVIASYAAWTTLGDIANTNETYVMALTMPFVLYGVFRYLWLAYRWNEGGAPEELLLTDKPLGATVMLWLITVVAILYFSP
jgi:4-hydroxybenzoate polyprenyltransferase